MRAVGWRTERLLRPLNLVWASIAIPVAVLAGVLLLSEIVGPFEWDGRAYSPRPARVALEQLPAAVGFAAFCFGVGSRRRGGFVAIWFLTTALWATILALEPGTGS